MAVVPFLCRDVHDVFTYVRRHEKGGDNRACRSNPAARSSPGLRSPGGVQTYRKPPLESKWSPNRYRISLLLSKSDVRKSLI